MRSNEDGRNKWVPPTKGIVRYYNDVPDAEETLIKYNDFCKACYTVSRDTGVLATTLTGEHKGKLQNFHWQFALADLVDGAEAGCHFCGLFTLRYFINSCQAPKQREKNEKFLKAISELREFSDKNPGAAFTFVVEPVDYNEQSGSFCLVRFSALHALDLDREAFAKMVMMIDIDLEFFAVKGSIATERIKRPPFGTQPASEEGVDQAGQWINECLTEHDECPEPNDPALPRRVIEILDDDNLVLRENLDGTVEGRYTALSYCWGGVQDFATTTKTLEHDLQGFKVSELATSLQDAVFLTRKLGLQYIWIDAMCIIQDSIEDKESEIPKMGPYFNNSHVTICAATSERSTKSFLKTRLACEYHPDSTLPFDILSMPYISQDGQYGKVLFRQPFPYVLAEEPIERRAWPLQERVLSPRVLNYGQWLVWQCQHHQRTWGGVDHFSYDKRTFNFRPVQALLKKKKKKQSEESSMDTPETPPGDIYAYWHQAVHAYSVRIMTLQSDKLPAIAALASVFAEASEDEYVAGLWRGNLLRELLWSTWPDIYIQKPDEYRAPTWSWASCDNNITYKHLPPVDARPVANVIGCRTTTYNTQSSSPMESSPFGHVTSGILELEGIVLPTPREFVKQLLNKENRMTPMDPFQGMWTPDYWDTVVQRCRSKDGVSNQDWEPPTSCAIMPLFMVVSKKGEGQETTGLVLAKNDDGTYVRIGMFKSIVAQRINKMLENCLERVVII